MNFILLNFIVFFFQNVFNLFKVVKSFLKDILPDVPSRLASIQLLFQTPSISNISLTEGNLLPVSPTKAI